MAHCICGTACLASSSGRLSHAEAAQNHPLTPNPLACGIPRRPSPQRRWRPRHRQRLPCRRCRPRLAPTASRRCRLPSARCTADLHALADWLKQHRCVDTVAMEASHHSVYWIALYDLLEARGSEVLLVDPRQIQHWAPGRPKSDTPGRPVDSARLHSLGSAQRRFRPDEGIPRVARITCAQPCAWAGHRVWPDHPAHAEGPGADQRQTDRGRLRHARVRPA